MLNNEIGKRIRKVRLDLDMTINDFAERIDISSSFLSDVELGKRGISAENIVKICSKCNISCDYLLMGVQSFGKVDESIAERLSNLPAKYNDHIIEMIDNLMSVIESTKSEFGNHS
jgi:transcriptional regulator with XRE-family HTH domain